MTKDYAEDVQSLQAQPAIEALQARGIEITKEIARKLNQLFPVQAVELVDFDGLLRHLDIELEEFKR